MRFLTVLFTLVFLAIGSLGWAGELQKEGFGKQMGGLVMRVRKAISPAGGSPLLQPIEVELRAPGKDAIPVSGSFATKLTLHTHDGKALPEGLVEFPTRSPLRGDGLNVKPGEPLKWRVNLLRTSDKAPTKLKVYGQIQRWGNVRRSPPLVSPLFELDLSKLPVAKTLEKKHVAAGWTSATTVHYALYQGLRGWRTLKVYPNGLARVFRSKSGKHDENDLPSGLHEALLTTAEQAALAKSFEKQQVWKLGELPKRMLMPDEPSATFTMVADDAALFARYPIAEARKANKGYAALEKELDALMHRIVKRAKKGKR